MKMYLLKCPNCDATLEVEPDRKMLFCSYCGSKIIVDDEVKRVEITKNINYHETYTDEAKIKETSSKEKIRLQEMEYADKEKKRNDKAIFISIGFLILIMLFAFGMSHYHSEKNKPNENQVKISANANDYKGELYEQVIKELESIGFKNFECIALKDLDNEWFTKEGAIEKISINGDFKFEDGDIFSKDAKVIILYHSMKE